MFGKKCRLVAQEENIFNDVVIEPYPCRF
jgi:hypothetical protein